MGRIGWCQSDFGFISLSAVSSMAKKFHLYEAATSGKSMRFIDSLVEFKWRKSIKIKY
jgi:hypothetical protein